MKDTFIEIMKSRRSIRKYRAQQVSDEELQAVLEAGTYAPSARGLQDPIIVAVQNATLRAELTQLNAAIYGRDIDTYYAAPTIVLVFASEGNANAIQDGSCVLENMMLAAHAIGLGSCWINRELEMFATPEGKELMRRMGLPEGLKGIGALSLGYPDGTIPTDKPRREGRIFVVR